MVHLHKVALFLTAAGLLALNLHARTGHPITWSYKGHFHQVEADYVRVVTPSGRKDDLLIPVQAYESSKDTGQRVVVLLVNAYCVPWYRGLAEDNLRLMFLGAAMTAIAWVIDRVRAKRYAVRDAGER